MRIVPAKVGRLVRRALAHDRVNFVLTNRLPRARLTRLMGRFAKIRHPLVSRASIAAWRLMSPELDLSEARQPRFASLHDCFIRELRPGARPVDADPRVVTSPSDGIVVACGRIHRDRLLQVKGRTYSLGDLLVQPALVEAHQDGWFATLRLKATMYHRFHAPHDCVAEQVVYVPGDVWNVNPAAVRRVERLYTRNERAVLRLTLPGGHPLTLVPVAAVLVGSIRLHFLDLLLHLDYAGPHAIPCRAALRKGQEMGWFQHGSTIVVLAPPALTPAAGIVEGAEVRMGRPLFTLP